MTQHMRAQEILLPLDIHTKYLYVHRWNRHSTNPASLCYLRLCVAGAEKLCATVETQHSLLVLEMITNALQKTVHLSCQSPHQDSWSLSLHDAKHIAPYTLWCCRCKGKLLRYLEEQNSLMKEEMYVTHADRESPPKAKKFEPLVTVDL